MREKLKPCPIKDAIEECLSYYDEEFPLEKYPNRERFYISEFSQGLQVCHLRTILEFWNTRSHDESMVLVPRKITPEMAYELESEIATPLPPSEIHAKNWQKAWERVISAIPEDRG